SSTDSPPSLHSFPTRRSSDLGCWRIFTAVAFRSMKRLYAPKTKTGRHYLHRRLGRRSTRSSRAREPGDQRKPHDSGGRRDGEWTDRKSTRLNSSHLGISYAVF